MLSLEGWARVPKGIQVKAHQVKGWRQVWELQRAGLGMRSSLALSKDEGQAGEGCGGDALGAHFWGP